MSIITKELITPEAYLAAERTSADKHEYVHGEIIPMGGASLPHNIIATNLARLIGTLLIDQDFTVCQSDMRVYNPVKGNYFYPDVVVIEGNPQLASDQFDNLLNPVLLIEVLSAGTASYDRGDKALDYRHIPSLKEYWMVSQDEAMVEQLVKIGDHKWQLEEISGLHRTVSLLLGLGEIKLADVYRKVTLSTHPA